MFLIQKMFVILSLAAAFAVSQTPALSQTGGLKLGDKYEGEIMGDKKTVETAFNVRANLHAAAIPITLKAGQGISITATVTGKNRQIIIVLLDPKGAFLESCKPAIKTGQLTFEEVPSTGKYTIVVASDLTGPFTLRATDPASGGEASIKALEMRIGQLRKQLAEAEAMLKALQAGAQGQ